MTKVQYLNRDEYLKRFKKYQKELESDVLFKDEKNEENDSSDAKEVQGLPNIGIRKQFVPENIRHVKQVDGDGEQQDLGEDSRIIEFTISTPIKDRQGDIIEVEGFDIENYKKNPVVLFAHDSTKPPIGRSIDIRKEGRRLISQAEFMDNDIDTSGFSDMIFRMIKGGFLKATSVGFLPIKFGFLGSEEDESDGTDFSPGIHFLEQELLEYSIVPVPANPEALIGAKSAGINIDPLDSWFEEALDRWTEYKDVLLIPKTYANKLYKLVHKEVSGKGDKTVSIPLLPSESQPTPEPKSEAENEAEKKDIESNVKGAISYNRAHPNGTPKAPEDAEWDAAKEVAAAEISDLLVMSAWRSDGPIDDLTKSDFKLPHHRANDSHTLVLRGVNAAMAALAGARGGVDIPDDDRTGVYNHLAKHLRDDFDREPPEIDLIMDEVLAVSKEFYPVIFGQEYAFDIESGEFYKVFEITDDTEPRKIIDEERIKQLVKKHLKYLASIDDPELSEKSITDLMETIGVKDSSEEENQQVGSEISDTNINPDTTAETKDVETDSGEISNGIQENTDDIEDIIDVKDVVKDAEVKGSEVIEPSTGADKSDEVDDEVDIASTDKANQQDTTEIDQTEIDQIESKEEGTETATTEKGSSGNDPSLNTVNTAKIKIGDVEITVSTNDPNVLSDIVKHTFDNNREDGGARTKSEEDNQSAATKHRVRKAPSDNTDNIDTDDEIDIDEVRKMVEEVMPDLLKEFKEVIKKHRSGDLDSYLETMEME